VPPQVAGDVLPDSGFAGVFLDHAADGVLRHRRRTLKGRLWF
jgi:hypothetical protein